jgi:hypothetical protein
MAHNLNHGEAVVDGAVLEGLARDINAAKADIRAIAAYLVERDQIRPTDAAWKRIAHLAAGGE